MRHVLVGVRAWGETVFWAVIAGAFYGPAMAMVVVGLDGSIDVQLIELFTLAAIVGCLYGVAFGLAYGAVVGVLCGVAAGVASRAMGARVPTGDWPRGEQRVSRLVGAVVAAVCTALVGLVPSRMAGSSGQVDAFGVVAFMVIPAVVAAAVFAWRTPTILTAPTPTLASRRPSDA
jgi:hypothetical protein